MYETFARAITCKLVRNGIINETKQEVYSYGFELMISYFVYFVIFTCISLLTFTLVESYCFFVGFMFVRKYAGGIHAKTYIRCHILFEINHLLFIAVYYFLSYEMWIWILFLFVLVSIILIWLFAPVDNNNKRLTAKEKMHFKKMSRIYTLFIGVMMVLTIVSPGIKQYAVSYLIGTCSASVSLVLAHFREKAVKN